MQHDLQGENQLKILSDKELVDLYIKEANADGFGELYRRYSTKVYSKCISMLKDESQAQDAVQEIFTKVYLNMSKFNFQSQFSTWLYSITYNFCIDFIRRVKREKNIFSDELENTPDLIDEVADSELLEMDLSRLKLVLEEIPSGDKAILLMKYQDDLSIKDIAGILDKTESAIKMQLKRAKHKTRLAYKDIFPND